MPLDTLDQDTTLITVNRRLSRVLRGEFDRGQLAAGAKVWESPDILPYSSWLQRTWNDIVAGADRSLPALLSAEQDLSLWEQVISQRLDGLSGDGEAPLLQSAEAARNAQAAWALLRAWRLDYDDDLGLANDEVRAFRGWAREYASHCRRGNWVEIGWTWRASAICWWMGSRWFMPAAPGVCGSPVSMHPRRNSNRCSPRSLSSVSR
jgi:hypothetical protein